MTIRRYVKRDGLLVPEGLGDPEHTISLAPLTAKLGGFYRLQLRRKSGSLKYDTGWFGNLITDLGMDQYGSTAGFSPSIAYCCVGTGASAPSFSDTTLVAPLAVIGPTTIQGAAYVAGPPAYAFQSAFWAYTLGSVIGNISEIGAGPIASGAGTTLSKFRTYSRQLILDSLGNPTTVSVTSSDQLNTSYQLRLYYDLTDSTTSINISGNTYGGTIRRSLTTIGNLGGPLATNGEPPSWGTTRAFLYTGTVGTTSAGPGGLSLSTPFHTYGIYTPGGFTKTVTSHWGTTNLGTVQSIQLGAPCLGFWQANLAPGFPKTSSNTLDISWSIAWARY